MGSLLGVCLVKMIQKNNLKNKSILLSIMRCWVLKNLLQLSKFEKLSGKKHWRNILIKEEILINLSWLPMPIRSYLILRKGSFMISMGNREFKMEDHLNLALEISLISSVEEAEEIQDPKRGKLSWLVLKLLSNKFIMAVWKKWKSKEWGIVKHAMEKEVRMWNNAQPVKERKLFRN